VHARTERQSDIPASGRGFPLPRAESDHDKQDIGMGARVRSAYARSFRYPTHGSPTAVRCTYGAAAAAGLRALGQALFSRKVQSTGRGFPSSWRAQCFNAGRSQLPLRGSSRIGVSRTGFPLRSATNGRHRWRGKDIVPLQVCQSTLGYDESPHGHDLMEPKGAANGLDC
jgi:hypothetical protein